jgi:hypothetical protein
MLAPLRRKSTKSEIRNPKQIRNKGPGTRRQGGKGNSKTGSVWDFFLRASNLFRISDLELLKMRFDAQSA